MGPIATTPFVTYQRSPAVADGALLGGKSESGATSRNVIEPRTPTLWKITLHALTGWDN